MNTKFSIAVFALILLACSFVHGQAATAVGNPVAVNQSGTPLASTLVTICTTNPGSGTCPTKVTLYTDNTLSTQCTGSAAFLNNLANPSVGSGCSNPGFTDLQGNVIAFSSGGFNWCQYSGSTITTFSTPCPFVPSGTGGGGNVFLAPSGAQPIIQPLSGTATTQFSANNLAGERWVTPDWNWSATDSAGSIGTLTSISPIFFITAASEVSTTATYTTSATCSFTAGQKVYIQGVQTAGYNGIFTVSSSCAGGSSFAAMLGSSGLASSSGGQAQAGLTLTLPTCPKGIDASANLNALYNVYISGTGTAEPVPVIGGTCTPGLASGTLIVVTANTHAAGFTVGSASTGIQEAINDVAQAGAGPHGRVVLLPAGPISSPNYTVYAPIYLKLRKAQFKANGAMLNCQTRSVCFMNGDYAASTGFWNQIEGVEFVPGINIDGVVITSLCGGSTCSASLQNGTVLVTTATAHPFVTGDYVIFFSTTPAASPEGRYAVVTGQACVGGGGSGGACTSTQFEFVNAASAFNFATSNGYGWASLENAAFEDTGDHNVVRDSKYSSIAGGALFHWGMVIGNDQSLLIDGWTNEGNGNVFRCDQKFCGGGIYMRGDQGMAPVVYLNHVELSMQCGGNGIRNVAGNTLHVKDTVVQGFNQYGVFYGGGLQPLWIGGVYQESSGACTNPFYPTLVAGSTAQAGVISNNDLTYTSDDPIGGALPSFVPTNTGSTQTNYFVFIHSSTNGNIGLFFIGSTLSTGSGNNVVYWPLPYLDGQGTLTFDLLATVGSSAVPPNGTGNYAVSTGISYASAGCGSGAQGLCSFTDPQTGYASYTVQGAQTLAPLNFWPGAFVLGRGSKMHANNCFQNGAYVTEGNTPTIFAQRSVPGGNVAQHIGFWCVVQNGESLGNNNPAIGAVLQQAGISAGTPTSGLTGLYGFYNNGGFAQGDLISLCYASPALVLATPGYRPANQANDCAIGLDSSAGSSASNARVGIRSNGGVAIYTASVLDGASMKYIFGPSSSTFNNPTVAAGTAATLSGTGACATLGSQVGGSWSGSVSCTGTTGASSITITPGLTAPHGWACKSTDITTGPLEGIQATSTTTNCKLNFSTVTANDTVVFSVNAF